MVGKAVNVFPRYGINSCVKKEEIDTLIKMYSSNALEFMLA